MPPYVPDGSHHLTSAAPEYAVLQLGVEHIVIMGHGRRNGIAAAVNQSGLPSSGNLIGRWLDRLRDAVRCVERDGDRREHQYETWMVQAGVEPLLADPWTFPGYGIVSSAANRMGMAHGPIS